MSLEKDSYTHLRVLGGLCGKKMEMGYFAGLTPIDNVHPSYGSLDFLLQD